MLQVSFDSLWLRERRGFIGLRGACCVMIGCALVLCSDFHYWLFGLVFSVGQKYVCLDKMADNRLPSPTFSKQKK